jgi:hypothetical protein
MTEKEKIIIEFEGKVIECEFVNKTNSPKRRADIPKTWQYIDCISHDKGDRYNPDIADLYIHKKTGAWAISIYRSGNFCPFFVPLKRLDK